MQNKQTQVISIVMQRSIHDDSYIRLQIYTKKRCVTRLRALNSGFPSQSPQPLSSHLTSKLLRPRNSISSGLVSIISDTSIATLVRTREPNKATRLGRSTSGNLELMAPRIELRTRVLVRGVQRNDFMAHEVVAWRDALGDGVCDGAAGDLEGVGAPDVGCALAAVFLDFEPDCTGGVLVSS